MKSVVLAPRSARLLNEMLRVARDLVAPHKGGSSCTMCHDHVDYCGCDLSELRSVVSRWVLLSGTDSRLNVKKE